MQPGPTWKAWSTLGNWEVERVVKWFVKFHVKCQSHGKINNTKNGFVTVRSWNMCYSMTIYCDIAVMLCKMMLYKYVLLEYFPMIDFFKKTQEQAAEQLRWVVGVLPHSKITTISAVLKENTAMILKKQPLVIILCCS